MRLAIRWKKQIPALLLCFLLLTGSVSADAPGSAGDPLISQSFVTDTFLPRVKSSLAALADSAVAEYLAKAEHTPAAKILTLVPGESVRLTAGEQFTLLSGAANVYVESGTVVNVTAGAAVENGAARLLSRCIVCEDSAADVDVTAESLLKVSYRAETGTGSRFNDVTRPDWFYSDVVSAVQRSLIDGMTPEIYDPAGSLTGGQCLKLAACMHQFHRSGAVTLKPSTDAVWYRSFVDYALANGILDAELEDYDAPVTREQFIELFYRALPESSYTRINSIPDGAIPDVAPGDACGPEVYAFYRAGILSGYTATAGYAQHAFGPESTITRAEVAAIMNRMFDSTARTRFTIG